MRAAGAVVPADGGGGGGGGSVDSVNGIAPVAGNVTLTAADIPSDGPSDVQADIAALQSESVVSTAISATTAGLGVADVYRGTAPSITITISSADITAGRRFTFKGVNPGISVGTPITIDTEGGELIDGAASTFITVDGGSFEFYELGGNLESR